jgi:hypothetical protein
MRGSDKPKSRMTLLDEKNKALDEEIRRLRAERQRLERDNPGSPSAIEKSTQSDDNKRLPNDRNGYKAGYSGVSVLPSGASPR